MRKDFELRNSALINLYPQIVSMRHVETENESFLDSSGNEVTISNEKVEEEIIKLKAEYDNDYSRKRQAEYPSIQECVHAILDDDLVALQEKRQAVKTKYPKS